MIDQSLERELLPKRGCHDIIHNIDASAKLGECHTIMQLSMASKLRISGILLLCGLAVTIVSLIWKAPLGFLVFAAIGVGLTFIGIVFYLFSLVSTHSGTS